MTRSPGCRSASPSATDDSKAIQASGAPSFPCLGAASRSVRADSTLPIGFSPNISAIPLLLAVAGALVDQDLHAVADRLRLGETERFLVARLAEEPLARPQHNREHHQPQLVHEIVLEQSLNERRTAVNDDVAVD